MNYKDVITLITITSSTNDIGDPVKVDTLTEVFADKMSIGQSEVYQAMAQGIKPAVKFKIRYEDYEGQQEFTYDSVRYKVIREFNAGDDEWIEITGSKLVV